MLASTTFIYDEEGNIAHYNDTGYATNTTILLEGGDNWIFIDLIIWWTKCLNKKSRLQHRYTCVTEYTPKLIWQFLILLIRKSKDVDVAIQAIVVYHCIQTKTMGNTLTIRGNLWKNRTLKWNKKQPTMQHT